MIPDSISRESFAALPDEPTATFKLGRPPSSESGELAHAHCGEMATHGLLAASQVRAAASRPSPPAVSGHEFELNRVIGRGGYGEVWESWQRSLRRRVAVKRLRGDLIEGGGSGDREQRLRDFQQEAMTAARLEHPNIIPVHDLGGDEKGLPQLAMKLVRGRPWNEILQQDFAAMEPAAYIAKHIEILRDVSHAVGFAHSKGVIHRDLKPSQVMVGRFGEVLLMDWGLAVSVAGDPNASTESVNWRAAGEDEYDFESTPPVGQASSPAGTPAYMAPEQTENSASGVGPWTDIYLLGGILYYILTNQPPHEGRTAFAAFENASRGRIRPPESAAPGRAMPKALCEIALRALAFDAGDRPASAEALIELLDGFTAGAHRRKESEALVDQVRKNIASNRGDYREHSQNLALLGSAEAMWPESPEVVPLRQEILAAFVRDATANREFTLARLHLDSMVAGPVRVELAAALDAAIRQFKSSRRTRSRLIAGLVLGLAGLLVAAIWRERMQSIRIEQLENAVPTGAAK